MTGLSTGFHPPTHQPAHTLDIHGSHAGPAPPVPEPRPSPSPSPSSANDTQPELPEEPLHVKTLTTPLKQGSSNDQCSTNYFESVNGDVFDLISQMVKHDINFIGKLPGITYIADDLHQDIEGSPSPENSIKKTADIKLDGCIHNVQQSLPEKSSQLGAKLLVSEKGALCSTGRSVDGCVKATAREARATGEGGGDQQQHVAGSRQTCSSLPLAAPG